MSNDHRRLNSTRLAPCATKQSLSERTTNRTARRTYVADNFFSKSHSDAVRGVRSRRTALVWMCLTRTRGAYVYVRSDDVNRLGRFDGEIRVFFFLKFFFRMKRQWLCIYYYYFFLQSRRSAVYFMTWSRIGAGCMRASVISLPRREKYCP